MAVNDDRPLADAAPRTDTGPRADDSDHDGSVERTVTTVKEGVDRVADKIKGLLGSSR